MDSIWNSWNYVEYVESTWNLWGSVKYTTLLQSFPSILFFPFLFPFVSDVYLCFPLYFQSISNFGLVKLFLAINTACS